MIWAERAAVALILASLAGAVHLVISIHREALREGEATSVAAVPAPETPRSPEPPPQVVVSPPTKPAKRPRPAPPPPPPAPTEDPTKKALAQLAEQAAKEIEETKRLDERAASLEKARLATIRGAEGWRRREMLVKQQLEALAQKVEKIDRDGDELAAQRDVLARERDALKAALAKAPGEGSYAVLPYKGPNGTWRRPIVLECTNGTVTLRPNGPTFSMLDLSGLINPRSSPVIVAIARELLKIQASDSPDGAPVAPYFVFLVRPDGIRPYYEARARLEPLGIAFGYELIDQDLKVDVPDFDNLETWDGSTPLDVPRSDLAGVGAGSGSDSGRGGTAGASGSAGLGGGGLAWPGAPGNSRSPGGTGPIAGAFAAGGRTRGAGLNGGDGGSPDDFVWPSARGGAGGGGGEGEGGRPGGRPGSGDSASAGGEGLGSGFNSGRGPGRGTGIGPAPGSGSRFDSLPPLEPAEPEAGPGGRGTAKPSSDLVQGPGGANRPTGGRVQIVPRSIGSPGLEGRPAEGGLPIEKLKELAAGTDDGPATPPRPGAPKPAAAGGGTIASNGVRPALEPAPGASGAREPGLMWGGSSEPTASASTMAAGGGAGSTATTTGEGGAGASAPDAAKGGGSGGGARALLGLGANQAAPNVARNAVPPGGLGVGLGSLAGLAGAGGPGESSSSNLDAGGGASGLALSSPGGRQEPSGGSAATSSELEFEPLVKDPNKASAPIDVPFEIVVACGPDGLVVHPGGYRITARSLKEHRGEKLLIRQLAAVALQRAQTDPGIRPKPRVKFLVENNGASTFWEARRQVLFAGLNWPMTLQVAGAQSPRLLDKEAW